MKRRLFVKSVAAAGALAGLGVLAPRVAMAAWNKEAFDAKEQSKAMSALLSGEATPSSAVTLKAPAIAENGAVVPVSVIGAESLGVVSSIAIFVEKNPNPLAIQFMIPEGTKADVSTRLRMGKTTNVTAVITTADGKSHSATSEVKVTIGGCGG